jgi:hypothetical protein
MNELEVTRDYQLVGKAKENREQVEKALKIWNSEARVVDYSKNTIRIADEDEMFEGHINDDDKLGECTNYLVDGVRYSEIVIVPWAKDYDDALPRILNHELGHAIRWQNVGGLSDEHLPPGNAMNQLVSFELVPPTTLDFDFVGEEP